MARYYDIDKLKEMIEAKANTLIEGKEAFLCVAKWLELLPLADVVEVVRCKDCEHRHTFGCPMYHEEYIDWDDDGYWETDLIIHDATNDNDFCNYGERNINERKEK